MAPLERSESVAKSSMSQALTPNFFLFVVCRAEKLCFSGRINKIVSRLCRRFRRRSRLGHLGELLGKAELFRSAREPLGEGTARRKNRLATFHIMFRISRSTPAYYFTSVAHHRLEIFRTDKLKQIICDAYAEARENHGILILAYVIMREHLHALVYSERELSEVLRLLNGISARRVIQYLKANNFTESLFKLRGSIRGRNHQHSVWHHHSDSLEIFGEETFRQKVEYIHMNPVKAGFVSEAKDYLYSSVRLWDGEARPDEPLATDLSQIKWW